MKRPFAETIKYMKAQAFLYIARKNDEVDMLDGHIIVRVPHVTYEAEFMPASPRFRSVEEGHCYCTHDKRKIPEETPNPYQTDHFFEQGWGAVPAVMTRCILDMNAGRFARLFLSEKKDNYVVLNENYAQILLEFMGFGCRPYMTGPKNPVIGAKPDGDKSYTCCLLPINAGVTEFADVLEVAYNVRLKEKEDEEKKD